MAQTLPSMTSTDTTSQDDCASAALQGGEMSPDCASGLQSDSANTNGMGSRQSQTQLQGAAPILPPRLIQGIPESPEHPTIEPANPSHLPSNAKVPQPSTEFEQIVADTVGRPLPVFGQSIFAQPPSTFAPTDHTNVPSDYVIGPDDELKVRIWGQLNADLRLTVDRGGQIYIPRVGQISVAGVHYNNLDQYLKDQVSRTFHNFDLTASIGKIRSLQVYIVGQAQYPGTYTISSLSTLVNAVFASGGPTPQGSLRGVQVQRDGKTVAQMDFYDLLVKGDKSKDIVLRSGDVISYPPVGPLVAIAGSVNAPAIYEMKHGAHLSDLLEVAGGLSTVADPSKVTIERIDETHARTVLEFPLDATSREMELHDGDIVRVFSIVPRFSNAVTLRGNVANPGRYPWRLGMRVRDLIPNAEALLTRQYWMTRAAMIEERSTEYPVRTAPRDLSTLNSTNRQNADNITESAGIVRSMPSGTVAPGTVPLGADADLSKSALGTTQGNTTRLSSSQPGMRKLNSDTLTADLHRASPEINWNYAIIQRVNPVDLSTHLLSFDLGKAVLEGDPVNNLELQPDDIVTVFSQSDMSVPESRRARYVRLEGEVVRAGVYKVDEGELLPDVIRRAGGLTPNAYVYGTQMTRESARIEQQRSIDELASTLEADVLQSAAAGNVPIAAQNALVTQLKSTKASGRVVLALKPNASTVGAYPPITVEDNDRIVIPHRPSTVSVVGRVYNPGSFVYDSRLRVGDYIRMAGRGRQYADMRHAFVLRADGTVVPSQSVNGMFKGDRFSSLRLYPGDQIVVPNKIPSNAFMRNLQNWSQISGQLALMGAALAVIQ